ncbi:spore coat protein [PVC group bacterium (ex Bugula neritina AB1)]|nr:spore coat protein [PVC group bacterium (ex Bugula neritina AB1)]
MKGVILAGGLGTRLMPLTKVTNKHLLPIYDKPMIYYPLELLVQAQIKDIMIVTGGNEAGGFLRLLGNGKNFGVKQLHYAYQEGEGGIAEALGLAEDFVDDEPFVVVLGDNIFEKSILSIVESFKSQKVGARVALKKVEDPSRFGVPSIKDGRISCIEEKPENPKSSYAVTGLYFYHPDVFDIVKTLKPSSRGELEISDVNNHYVHKGEMLFDEIDGWWSDAGTITSLYRTNQLVASLREKESL